MYYSVIIDGVVEFVSTGIRNNNNDDCKSLVIIINTIVDQIVIIIDEIESQMVNVLSSLSQELVYKVSPLDNGECMVL